MAKQRLPFTLYRGDTRIAFGVYYPVGCNLQVLWSEAHDGYCGVQYSTWHQLLHSFDWDRLEMDS